MTRPKKKIEPPPPPPEIDLESLLPDWPKMKNILILTKTKTHRMGLSNDIVRFNDHRYFFLSLDDIGYKICGVKFDVVILQEEITTKEIPESLYPALVGITGKTIVRV